MDSHRGSSFLWPLSSISVPWLLSLLWAPCPSQNSAGEVGECGVEKPKPQTHRPGLGPALALVPRRLGQGTMAQALLYEDQPSSRWKEAIWRPDSRRGTTQGSPPRPQWPQNMASASPRARQPPLLLSL